jgi:hypothetical protein
VSLDGHGAQPFCYRTPSKRRAEELETSAVAVRDAEIEPTMAEAVARRLRWKANLEPKDHFDGIVPETIEDTLNAMERKMAKDA